MRWLFHRRFRRGSQRPTFLRLIFSSCADATRAQRKRLRFNVDSEQSKREKQQSDDISSAGDETDETDDDVATNAKERVTTQDLRASPTAVSSQWHCKQR